MSASPRVVLGLPAFSRPDALPRTLESLLSQTWRDYALVVVDDAGSAETAAIVKQYAPELPRVHYEANASRLGMVGNWRRVAERARTLFPEHDYFAWVSDHDVWHPLFLERLVAVLDANPGVVLAYPECLRMVPDDAKRTGPGFHTFGVTRRRTRMRQSARHLLAGDMIYGLMRARALGAAGVFRHVVTPDRQVLLALSLFGQFRQVSDVLWCREFVRMFDIQRQRDVFSPDGIPPYMYLPSHLQHFITLLWDFGIRGAGRPAFGRLSGAGLAVTQLWWSMVRQLAQPKGGWRAAVGMSR
jgi:glycosyltransferase involved in cell wall biosynthesis